MTSFADMRSTSEAAVLGETGASFLPILAALLGDIGPHAYEFMSAANYDEVLRHDLRDAMRIYWLEILNRAHFGACAGLMRSNRWFAAILDHAGTANYTAFCAAYRGCLEASADSFQSFESIPSMIADVHTVIRKAVVGHADVLCLFKKLEDELIHFTHARHIAKGEVVDESHRARVTNQYLDSLFGKDIPEGTDCYRVLCDVTHPGIGSIRCYADGFRTEKGAGYRLRFDQDAQLIAEFCAQYKRVSERMAFAGVIPPAVMLRILNDLPIEALHTPSVMKIGLERQPVWRHFAAKLADPRSPEERGIGTRLSPE